MDFKNVFNLIRCFIVEKFKKEFTPLIVIAVVVPILSDFDTIVFVYTFLSILFAARIFKNLQNSQSAIAYMMMPASPAEKTMANFLLVSVIYPLVCALFSLIALGVDVLFFKFFQDYPYTMPQDIGVSLGFFLLLAIFSFASVYYKKHSFWNVCLCSYDKNAGGVNYEHYGDILYKLGEKGKAVQNWKKAKKLGDASEFIEQKIKDEKIYE